MNSKTRFRTLRIFWNGIFFIGGHRDRLSALMSKTKKIGKLIFHSFQNIAQQFRPKNGDGSF